MNQLMFCIPNILLCGTLGRGMAGENSQANELKK